MIGRLARKGTYEYNQGEVDEIMIALRDAVDDVERAFSVDEQETKVSFRLMSYPS